MQARHGFPNYRQSSHIVTYDFSSTILRHWISFSVLSLFRVRQFQYHIPIMSRFALKGMAGNIVHAIATTNAIAAGLIVLEAFKVCRRCGQCLPLLIFVVSSRPRVFRKLCPCFVFLLASVDLLNQIVSRQAAFPALNTTLSLFFNLIFWSAGPARAMGPVSHLLDQAPGPQGPPAVHAGAAQPGVHHLPPPDHPAARGHQHVHARTAVQGRAAEGHGAE